MSTNSTVSIQASNGTVQTIYVHHDGYNEGGVGEALATRYNNREAIQALVDGGDHSCISLTRTESYKQMRNEDCPAETSNSILDAMRELSQQYNYFYNKDDELSMIGRAGQEIRVLTDTPTYTDERVISL